MRRARGGQMEIMGLVIIVILITLGMLFLATFAFPEKKTFVSKGLALSTMASLMKTGLAFESEDGFGNKIITRLRVEDLVKKCAEETGLEEKPVCDFLKEEIGKLLAKSLGAWGKHYEFKSTLTGAGEWEKPLIEIKDEQEGKGGKEEKGCPGKRDSSDNFPLSTEGGVVMNILYLCD